MLFAFDQELRPRMIIGEKFTPSIFQSTHAEEVFLAFHIHRRPQED